MVAHINESGERQSIKEHLQGTAKIAESFAQEFGCGEMGYFCAMLHDIGKYSEAFQKRIEDPEHVKKVDHSTAGALEAMGQNNVPAAMAIAGHHSGLMDGGSFKLAREGDGTFFGRLKKQIPDYGNWKEDIILPHAKIPPFCMEGDNKEFTMSFFIRMLYSCLVDADYLDTERFMGRDGAKRGGYSQADELCFRFDQYIGQWLKRKPSADPKQELLGGRRNQILKTCMEKGGRFNRGLYTLTVPTGGGKTTASLGFALKHIQKNAMKRVIYVIPYTSIIDQNAEVFGRILGRENVLEHHSGTLYEVSEDSPESAQNYRKALATENWDMPVIVTTAVQFFESLFSSRSSKCRKLHNITNSVIIFDEAQTLPVSYLEPCAAAISELVLHYRSTVVLCTATQPALESVFARYMPDRTVREICDNTEEIYHHFRRTRIINVGVLSREALREEIEDKPQVLCIVNKRKTAQQLYADLPKEGTYCLTTLLCPAHRKKKFAEIRQRLERGETCRVIATSLIEAGVDLDFPKVYRQEAGLDSLIQAAGRCNREGKRKTEDSLVSLFRLEGESASFIRQNIDALNETLRHYEDMMDLSAISFYFRFYRELIGEENRDQQGVMDAFRRGIDGKIYPFASVDRKFKLIEERTKTVYIPVDEGRLCVERMEAGHLTRDLFRKAGQYSVNVFPDHFKELWEAGCLDVMDDTIFVLRDMNQYRKDTGLQLDVETGYGICI